MKNNLILSPLLMYVEQVTELENYLKKTGKKVEEVRCGQERSPIFEHIPTERIVFDLLHLYLRVCDKLSKLLHNDLINADAKEKANNKTLKTNYVTQYYSFLSISCKISKPVYCDLKEKRTLLRDLRGGEYNRVMQNFNFEKIFPNLEVTAQMDSNILSERFGKIQNLWKSFYAIIQRIKGNDISGIELKVTTRVWLEHFIEIYDCIEITPYMHIFAYHLHELHGLYGNVNQFNGEGLEKKNDILKSQYHRATNKHVDYLKQLLFHQNRMDILSHLGDGHVINH